MQMIETLRKSKTEFSETTESNFHLQTESLNHEITLFDHVDTKPIENLVIHAQTQPLKK